MECPVCFDIFKIPLLLPGCGHTICQKCVELLITEGNFLRCPECRLTYQLRRGIKSLPKNVALQRTIEEYQRNISLRGVMCNTHPEDAAHLYCKTCEKLICLKCYFSNTLRKGESTHSGHQVDTSEDIFSKEKRLLYEACKQADTLKQVEIENLKALETSEQYLKNILETKLKEIDQNKVDLISSIKHTAGKLKFTLNGTVAKEVDNLVCHLECARNKVHAIENSLSHSNDVLKKFSCENPEINPIKDARRKLESVLSNFKNQHVDFSSLKDVEKFNTDVISCFLDPKKALAYHTEPPKRPHLDRESFIISNTRLLAVVKYSETVRVKCIEIMYKGIEERKWSKAEEANPTKGVCKLIITGLQRGTAYEMYAVASNEFGQSTPSTTIWFQTFEGEVVVTDVDSSVL